MWINTVQLPRMWRVNRDPPIDLTEMASISNDPGNRHTDYQSRMRRWMTPRTNTREG